MKLDEASTWPTPAQTATSVHDRYGRVAVAAWGHYHPKLQRRAGWAAHPGPLPIVEGTLIHIQVDRLPGDRAPKPVWLWHSHPDAAGLDVLRLFHIFLRRFDLEHTFRFFKQTLGWTRPRLRHPDQAVSSPGFTETFDHGLMAMEGVVRGGTRRSTPTSCVPGRCGCTGSRTRSR
jgi:hypothetical protein